MYSVEHINMNILSGKLRFCVN